VAYTLKDLPIEIRFKLLSRFGIHTLKTCPVIRSRIVMLVPSVIHTTTANVMGQTHRSVFSSSERFHQTRLQLQDISALPDTKAVLLEGSIPTFQEMITLSKYASIVLTSFDEKGDAYANHHPNKSINEVYVIHKMLLHIQSDWVFKFGARYRLLPSFQLDQFLQKTPVCKRIEASHNFTDKPIYNTVLYSFPSRSLMQMLSLYQSMEMALVNGEDAIENVMCTYFERQFKMTYVDHLHIYGRDGYYGQPNYL
jgi:hypothetical protein